MSKKKQKKETRQPRSGSSTVQELVIEVRPGNGGLDAEEFTLELRHSIESALKRAGLPAYVEDLSHRGRGFLVSTEADITDLSWLQGTHMVQRIPRGSAARHTSSATVLVRTKISAKLVDDIHEHHPDIRVDRYRGSGPGGQHRNKVSTAVRIVHHPTGIVITRESGRSQTSNLTSALDQLRDELQSRQVDKSNQSLAQSRSMLDPRASDITRKTFTHNEQRGEVVYHPTGRRFRLKDWKSGKFNILAH